MQPAADEDSLEPDFIIPRRVIALVGSVVAWVGLGAFAITHPGVDYSRSVPAPHQLFFYMLTMLPGTSWAVFFSGGVLVWLALLRPQWSDRLLFVAAVSLSWVPIAGGVDEATRQYFHHAYSSTGVTVDAVAYGSAALVSSGSLRLILTVILAYLLLALFFVGLTTLVEMAGGLLLAAIVIQIGLLILDRAKIDVLSDATA